MTTKILHKYEDYVARALRLKSRDVRAQALCSTGDAHRKYALTDEKVTCKACLKVMKGMK